MTFLYSSQPCNRVSNLPFFPLVDKRMVCTYHILKFSSLSIISIWTLHPSQQFPGESLNLLLHHRPLTHQLSSWDLPPLLARVNLLFPRSNDFQYFVYFCTFSIISLNNSSIIGHFSVDSCWLMVCLGIEYSFKINDLDFWFQFQNLKSSEVITLVLATGKELNTLKIMTLLGRIRELRSQGKLLLPDLERMVNPES